MKQNYNFTQKCPDASHYKIYLGNGGANEFMDAFTLHLKSCEFCRESIAGYHGKKMVDIDIPLNTVSKSFLRKTKNTKKQFISYFGYAASIIVFIGFAVFYSNSKNFNENALANEAIDYSLLLETSPNQNKTLIKKETDQYIYIDDCNKIAYNDQFLSVPELSKLLKKQENNNLITIEVATTNYQCALDIINSIKQQTSAPIITISNTKGLKKLTPWGGDLGG